MKALKPSTRIIALLTFGLVLLYFFELPILDSLILIIIFGYTLELLSYLLHKSSCSSCNSSPSVTCLFSIRATLLWLSSLILIFKTIWVILLSPENTIKYEIDLRDELFSRKKYLVVRIINQKFGPDDSPGILPQEFKEEWAIGTLSMLGSALTNLSFIYPETRDENSAYVKLIIERFLKDDIRIFETSYWKEDALDSLDGPNGHIGYLGHLNYLLGAYRVLGGGNEYEDLNRKISDSLGRRIKESPHKYLETFPDQIFIPDNIVVLASLRLFDLNHRTELFKSVINDWLEYSQAKLLDKETKIFLPWINTNGRGFGAPRGSYATWNVFYLMNVDREFAKSQALLIKDHFLARLPFKHCAFREYLPDRSGPADIDSGPVIFGLSTSGTGFGMASARLLDDNELMKCLLRTAEVAGSSISTDNGSRYAMAPLIGDAIILAMRTATTWDDRFLK